MNGDLRKIALKVLDERQINDCEKQNIKYLGRYCERGGYEITDKRGIKCRGGLVVHHRDNDNSNNPKDGTNWEYLCRGHNIREDAPGIHRNSNRNDVSYMGIKISLKRVRGKVGDNEIKEVKAVSGEFEKNKRCEGVFRQLVEMVVEEQKEVKVNILAEAGAEYTTQTFGAGNGIDQQTGMRYLRKMCAPFVGKYELFQKTNGSGKEEWWVRKISNR